MLTADLIDIPIDVFGGYCPSIAPSVLPPGASPLTQDCYYPEGAVATRPGLLQLFGPGNGIPANASINGLKTYLNPGLQDHLIVWDSLGNLYKETPDGTLTLLFSRPQGAGTLYQSVTQFGREYQAFYGVDPLAGLDIPRQYDDTYWDRVSHSGPGIAPTVADSATAGNIAAGKRQIGVAFINRQGWISIASPVPAATTAQTSGTGYWTAAGSKQAAVTNIATGPPNIVARLLLFTPAISAPAVTGTFYSLPNGTTQLSTPTIMLINDNVTTSVTVDFTDAILIAGFQAEFLFTQIELGECANVNAYNSRMVWCGERNKVLNFVNTEFDGGFGGTPASTNTGATSPGAGASGPAPPGIVGALLWNNPNNILAADGVVTTCNLGSTSNAASAYLVASNYGFAIPSNATILGIVAIVRVASNNGTARDLSVKIQKAGTLTGVDHHNGNTWTSSLANQTYGNSGDLWGLSWTPADINNVGFGVGVSAWNPTASSLEVAKVDYISITVYYSTPSGSSVPLGWTAGASNAGGSSAIAGGYIVDWGDAYAITGDGATAERGQITQSAYQDYLLNPVINRNISYRVRARVALAGGLTQGTLHINLQSTSGGFTTSGLSVQVTQLTANYAEFDGLLTTALISPPTDLLLQVYADGTPNNGGVFLVDSIGVYPANVPYNYSVARVSYAFNPEGYDGVTGQIQIRPNDGQMLHASFTIRGNLYFGKDHYLCYVTDDGINEPASWSVTEVSDSVGICGPNALDWNEEWAVFAERSGLYLFWGSDPVKITPEIQNDASGTGKITWNSINWAAAQTIWVRIDRINRNILVGAPVNGATTPNVVFMLDYRWLDTPQDIAASPLVTYSAFTGKVLAHGRGRRWMLWNISAASMTFAERANGTLLPIYGNNAGNGTISQQLVGQTSDNGVAINSFYQTHFAPSHMEEQTVQLGAHRKLLGYLKYRATGSGNMTISITTAQRTTQLRSYVLSANPPADGERPLNLHGERFSITVGTNFAGSFFQLEQLIPCMKKDAAIVVRGVS